MRSDRGEGAAQVRAGDHYEEREEDRKRHSRRHPPRELVAYPPPPRPPERGLEGLAAAHRVDGQAVEYREVEVHEEEPEESLGHKRGGAPEWGGVEGRKDIREGHHVLGGAEGGNLHKVSDGGELVRGCVGARYPLQV